MDIDISVRHRGHEQPEQGQETQNYYANKTHAFPSPVSPYMIFRPKWIHEPTIRWISVSTSLANSLKYLACNDAVPFDCEHTASTIAALAADLVITAPLVCAVLGTGIASSPFSPLAFGLRMGLDLDLLPLRSTITCRPDDSGAYTGADVGLG